MKKFLFLFLFAVQFLHAANDYKIYDTLRVNHNTIRLDILDFKNQVISGEAEISLESKMDDLRYVPILLQDMRIDRVSINGKAVKGFQYDSTLLRIPVATPLREGEKALLSIKYHGKPAGSDFGGLVIKDSLRSAHNMGASLEEIPHSYGRGWFPATDDFRSRSTFDLYYRVSSDLKAISTGILQDTVSNGDGTTTWHWRVNHAIPDYLVAIAVGDYEKIHYDYRQSSRDLPIDVYVFPNEVKEAKETYAIVPKVLEVMEKYFGEMIFDRVGYVSVNGTHGAMEHVNNISMPPRPVPTPEYQSYIIHELIHSWFGNRVTCATAEDMWLNEGITSFVTGMVMEELYPADIAMQYWKDCQATALILSPMYEGGYLPLYPMPQAFTYGPTVYMKGAMLISTLKEYLGDDVLYPALKKYLEAYSLKHVTTKEFETFMSQATGRDLSGFFEQWIYRPGFMGFEIDSLKGSYDGNTYKGTLFIEQKLCGTTSYGEDVKVPVTFFDKEGVKRENVEVEISGAQAKADIRLPFDPSFGVVDADYRICKASIFEPVRIDSVGVYAQRYSKATLRCKSMDKPFTVYMEYYQIAPDAMKASSDIRLYPNCYWRLNGEFPAAELSGQFQVNPTEEVFAALKESGKPVLVLYRPSPAEDWTEIASVSFADLEKSGVAVDSLRSGEYCLGF